MIIEDFSPTPIRLLPDKALLILGEEKQLVVADIHLGKSATFRARGLPVPEGDTTRDLARLSDLVRDHSPDRLIVAGDMFHASAGFTDSLAAEMIDFIERIGIPLILVSGNHDQKIAAIPEEIPQCHSLDLHGLRIIHKPEDAVEGLPTICGHIHPVLRIPDGRKTSLRLPCFRLSGMLLTLPAFGSFTGGHIVTPNKGDRFFVAHREEVIEVPESLLRKTR